MFKLYITLSVLCFFGAVLVKGHDKSTIIASFLAEMNECKAEVGAKDADVEEMTKKKPASTMEGKCLRSCIMKRFKVMDDNGKFVKDIAVSHAEKFTENADDRKTIREITDKCSGIKVDDDHCEAADQYGKCVDDQATAHGLTEKFKF